MPSLGRGVHARSKTLGWLLSSSPIELLQKLLLGYLPCQAWLSSNPQSCQPKARPQQTTGNAPKNGHSNWLSRSTKSTAATTLIKKRPGSPRSIINERTLAASNRNSASHCLDACTLYIRGCEVKRRCGINANQHSQRLLHSQRQDANLKRQGGQRGSLRFLCRLVYQ